MINTTRKHSVDKFNLDSLHGEGLDWDSTCMGKNAAQKSKDNNLCLGKERQKRYDPFFLENDADKFYEYFDLKLNYNNFLFVLYIICHEFYPVS